MRRNPSQATSEKYNMNMSTFDNGQPEEFLVLLRNFKIAIDRTSMTMPTGRINYLCTMLREKSLREFDEISLQENTTNNHLKHTTEGLIEYPHPPSPSALSNQKRAMRRAMRKPCSMPFNRFETRLTEINNFLPLFPGPDASKRTPPEELN